MYVLNEFIELITLLILLIVTIMITLELAVFCIILHVFHASHILQGQTNTIFITFHLFHRGLEAIAVDYVRASIFGPIIPKIAIGLVYLLCIATLGGLFYVITHDVGIANTIRNIWAIKSEQNA